MWLESAANGAVGMLTSLSSSKKGGLQQNCSVDGYSAVFLVFAAAKALFCVAQHDTYSYIVGGAQLLLKWTRFLLELLQSRNTWRPFQFR